mmetsp:Transcript_65192/g.184018  ORF Transcript_65192/g.184018 Transcript_65192/m.184018 type:complete len:255 (-) Transcript_65192:97-861(-)
MFPQRPRRSYCANMPCSIRRQFLSASRAPSSCQFCRGPSTSRARCPRHLGELLGRLGEPAQASPDVGPRAPPPRPWPSRWSVPRNPPRPGPRPARPAPRAGHRPHAAVPRAPAAPAPVAEATATVATVAKASAVVVGPMDQRRPWQRWWRRRQRQAAVSACQAATGSAGLPRRTCRPRAAPGSVPRPTAVPRRPPQRHPRHVPLRRSLRGRSLRPRKCCLLGATMAERRRPCPDAPAARGVERPAWQQHGRHPP